MSDARVPRPVLVVNGKAFATASSGGAVRVALNVVREMAVAAPDLRFLVIMPLPPRQAVPAFEFPDNVEILADRTWLANSSLGRSAWEQLVLPRRARGVCGRLAVLNLTNSAPVLFAPGAPQLLVVHDVGFWDARWFARSFGLYLRLVMMFAVRRRIQLVTVSETSRRQIEERLPSSGNVRVIPNGCDEPPPGSGEHADGRFVLFLGSINPRKNLRGAIAGFEAFRRQHGDEVRLLVVGAAKALFADGELKPVDGVEFTGYVDEPRKWALLRGAEALLLPSFLEGFGLPIVEAMKVGTPVVASDIPVFRELFGDAVEFVDPTSSDDIGRGLAAVLNDKHRQCELRKAGAKVAARYAWPACARRYLELLDGL